jgi:hypothetical protein
MRNGEMKCGRLERSALLSVKTTKKHPTTL